MKSNASTSDHVHVIAKSDHHRARPPWADWRMSTEWCQCGAHRVVTYWTDREGITTITSGDWTGGTSE